MISNPNTEDPKIFDLLSFFIYLKKPLMEIPMKSPRMSTCVLEFYSTILVLNVFYAARIPKETFPSSIMERE